MVRFRQTVVLVGFVSLLLSLTACVRAASTPQAQGVSYVVQSGETLTDIAQKCGLTEIEIMRANNIENSREVVEGRLLQLPYCKGSSEQAKVLPTSTSTLVPLPTETLIPQPPTPVKPSPEPLSSPVPIKSELPAGSIWVSSYPPGANVYVLPGANEDYETLEEIVQAEYYAGITPAFIPVKSNAQSITVVVAAEKLTALGYRLPLVEDDSGRKAFEFDGNQSRFWRFKTSGEVIYFGKLYHLDLQELDESSALISLLIPFDKENLPSAHPYLYPPLNQIKTLPVAYSFDKKERESLLLAILKTLDDYNLLDTIPEEMVAEMFLAIQRVGKVVLVTKEVELVVQMGAPGTEAFTIEVFY